MCIVRVLSVVMVVACLVAAGLDCPAPARGGGGGHGGGGGGHGGAGLSAGYTSHGGSGGGANIGRTNAVGRTGRRPWGYGGYGYGGGGYGYGYDGGGYDETNPNLWGNGGGYDWGGNPGAGGPVSSSGGSHANSSLPPFLDDDAYGSVIHNYDWSQPHNPESSGGRPVNYEPGTRRTFGPLSGGSRQTYEDVCLLPHVVRARGLG